MKTRGSPENTVPRRSAIVTLTDFGRDSFYVGAMKAAVIAVDPHALIVDLTHGIRPFAVEEASFVLSLVFDFWGAGSVFLVVVDPGVGGDRRNLIVESANRVVVGPDNGLVSDVAARFGVDAAFAITDDGIARVRKHRPAGRTFLGRDVFAPAAAFLAAGGDPGRIADRIDGYHRLALPIVDVGKGYVRGQGRYVDDFGNILTNISRGCLQPAFGDTPLDKLRINVNNMVRVDRVVESFSTGGPGELLAVLDSWNFIELSVNQGRAADRFAADRPVLVEITRV